MDSKMLELLMTRRSVRAYKPEQITEEELDAVTKAGTYAPTGMGMQSPVIIAVQNPQAVQKLVQLNAKVMNSDSNPYYGAPTILLVLASSERGNRVEDGSCVLENMMLAACAMGLGSCWINQPFYLQEDEEMKAFLADIGAQPEEFACCSLALGLPEGPLFPGRRERTGNPVTWLTGEKNN